METKKIFCDITKCVGCRACELACAIEHSATKDLFLAILESPKPKKRIDNRHIANLEKEIKAIEKKNILQECCFYLPGENFLSAALDISRTVARRVERQVVTLKRKKLLKNPYILIYLNRLSDLLYLLARAHEKKHRKI